MYAAVEADVLLLVPRVSAMDSIKGSAMATGHEPPSPGEESVTAEDVDLAEDRAKEAGERAAHAGLAAARSIEESARFHEQVANGQVRTIEQGASDAGAHQKSVIRHRQAAADDRKAAEQKRKESEADLSLDTDR